MKKDFMKAMFLMLCAVFAFTFTACSDDDDPVDDAATQVAGSYSGTLDVTMLGNPLIEDEQKTIVLAKNTENSINLSIANFSLDITGLGTVNLGDVTISNCTLTPSGEGHAFSGTVHLTNLTLPGVGQGDCDVNIENATVIGNTVTLPLGIDVFMPGTTTELPLDIKANFTGTK